MKTEEILINLYFFQKMCIFIIALFEIRVSSLSIYMFYKISEPSVVKCTFPSAIFNVKKSLPYGRDFFLY